MHSMACMCRGRPTLLERMLPVTAECVAKSGVDFAIFVVEQSDKLHFNRGALMNVGALLLEVRRGLAMVICVVILERTPNFSPTALSTVFVKTTCPFSAPHTTRAYQWQWANYI